MMEDWMRLFPTTYCSCYPNWGNGPCWRDFAEEAIAMNSWTYILTAYSVGSTGIQLRGYG